jgi:WD40 repeat protein
MCAQTLTDCLGEITSVEFDNDGKYLLAGCKDNSNRLFDLRMVCPPSLSAPHDITQLTDLAKEHLPIYRTSKYIQEPNQISFRLERSTCSIRLGRWTSLYLAKRDLSLFLRV